MLKVDIEGDCSSEQAKLSNLRWSVFNGVKMTHCVWMGRYSYLDFKTCSIRL